LIISCTENNPAWRKLRGDHCIKTSGNFGFYFPAHQNFSSSPELIASPVWTEFSQQVMNQSSTIQFYQKF